MRNQHNGNKRNLNQRFVIAWALLTACALALAGCQTSGILFGGQSQPTYTPFMPLSATPSATATSTVTATATPQPSPTATPQPSPTANPCSGETGQLQVHTQADGAPLDYRIYLPPCYGELPGITYPVLYILHGQTYQDDQWDRLGIDEAAESMIIAHEAPPFIIVMPLEANTLGDIFETRFGQHLAEELVPWIDSHYATCAQRDCRAIGGLSRGGAWALNTGFRFWSLFGSVGLHSTPPFVNDAYRLLDWIKEMPAQQTTRLWLDTGKQDWYLKITTEFEGFLVEHNIPHEWHLFDGTHDEVYWSAHVVDYLRWYTQPWQEQFSNLP